MSAIVVEQHAQKILAITDEAIILDRGAVVRRAPSHQLRTDFATLERYLGVAKTTTVPMKRSGAAGPHDANPT